jgi:transcriptional regulator with XRE-family HTH domain
MHIGEQLKIYREQSNLTQQVVANYLGIKRELLSYYENGEREAPLSVLEKVVDLYGIDLADLFEADPNQISANIAFAFRAETIQESDLIELALFRRAIKNYFKICELEKKDV